MAKLKTLEQLKKAKVTVTRVNYEREADIPAGVTFKLFRYPGKKGSTFSCQDDQFCVGFNILKNGWQSQIFLTPWTTNYAEALGVFESFARQLGIRLGGEWK